MTFLVKALISWNKCSKNADISSLSNFLANSFQFFFSISRNFAKYCLQYHTSFKSIGISKQNYRGGRVQSVKSSAGLRLNTFMYYFLTLYLSRLLLKFVEIVLKYALGPLYQKLGTHYQPKDLLRVIQDVIFQTNEE